MLAVGANRSLSAAVDTIRINIPGPQLMPFFPVELIPHLGIDRDLGANLGIRYHPTGVLALEDLLKGNADFAGVGFPVLPKFVKKGHEVKAIARLSSGAPPYAIVVRKELAAEIPDIAALRGRTLGAPMGSATTKTYLQLIAELWLSAHGVTPDQVRWAPITQTYDGVYGAMAGETVDAVFCEEPCSAGLVRAGIGQVLASLNDARNPVRLVGRGHLRAVIVTTPERIQAHPERAFAMAQMLQRVLRWSSMAAPEELVGQLRIKDANQRADILATLKRLPWPYSKDGDFLQAEIDATREFMRVVGIALPGNADIVSLIDDRWVRAD